MKGGTRSQMSLDNISVTSTVLGVNEVAGSVQSFTVYPNPARNEFRIRMNNPAEKYVVSIYDILGNKVYSGNTINNEVATDKLTNGYYFVELVNRNTNQSSFNKLIIQK